MKRRVKRRAPLLCWASVFAIAAGFLLLHGSNLHRARGDDEKAAELQPYLTIHGPNDGEPLNNSIQLRLDVALKTPSYVLLYQESRYLLTAPVVPAHPNLNGPTQTVFVPIDSTYFPNGPFSLSFYLFDERMERLVDTAFWKGLIENPFLEPVGKPIGQDLAFQIRGRSGDYGYQIEASRSIEELLRSPGDGLPRKVEILTSGAFDTRGDNGSLTRPRVQEIMLNVDNLIQTHTEDGFLILWTSHQGAQWAHSKPISIRSLPRPAAAPLFHSPSPPAPRSQYKR